MEQMHIGILGTGKLGLCFGLNLERSGFRITGVDVHEDYINALNQKTFFSHEPQVNELLRASLNFTATSHIQEVLTDDVKVLFVMVATPSLPDGAYDHAQIERVAGALINFGKRNSAIHLVIGCTVMPGYTQTLQTRLAEYNYTVSYNPEFIAQGNIIHDQLYPDQILIGEANEDIGDILENIYHKLCKSNPRICRMDALSAEICKIATNCFLTTKISFANSIGDLATKAGANPEHILAAIGADSRIGEKYLQYGFGFGGPCFPRDNRALNLFAQQTNYRMLIGEATDKVNQQHLDFQYEQLLAEGRDEYFFDEVTYKQGTVILDESQKLALAVKLAIAGKKVILTEKEAVIVELEKNFKNLFEYVRKT
jgi:nucleotide sugar dehydrogenase